MTGGKENPLAQFLGDLAFLAELGLVAAGLVLLHVGRERSASLLRAAGWLLVIGATATAICTTFFWFRYHRAGEFDHAGRPETSRLEERASNLDSLDFTLSA